MGKNKNNKKTRKSKLKKKIYISVAVVLLLMMVNIIIIDISPDYLAEAVGKYTVVGPLIFLGVYLVRTFLLLPISILYVAGGLLYGPLEATMYAALGGTIAGIILYGVAKFFDMEEVLDLFPKDKVTALKQEMEDYGFVYIFILRNVPIVNFDLTSYAAGLSSVPFRAFLLGTFFGSIPQAYLYGYIGFSFSQGEYYQGILLMLAVFLLAYLMTLYMNKSKKKRKVKRMLEDKQKADIKTPSFWDNLWQKSLQDGARKAHTVEESVALSLQRWSKRSKPFSENVLGSKGAPRVTKVIEWIESQSISLAGMKILDIGSGPGAFTIPLATKASNVVALEPVAEMVHVLKEQLILNNIDNVEIVQEAWELVDIEQLKWQKAYDLVFASMVPGINDQKTLEKALACASKYCYISSFAGKREYQAVVDLWPKIFGVNQPEFHLDIQYLLNILYVSGYSFSFKVWQENKKQLIKKEVAKEDILRQIQMMTDELSYNKLINEQEKVKTIIDDYVESKAVADDFEHRASTRLAAILVDVN